MLSQKTKIRKVGNSQGIILSSDLLSSLNVSEDGFVQIIQQDGALIIMAVGPTLDDLVSTVPKGTKFSEAKTRPSRGREV